MEIQAQENLKEKAFFKFVLLNEERGQILHLFYRKKTHTNFAPDNKDEFIGAGTVTVIYPEAPEVKWGSDTFRRNPDFKRDRPEDESRAAEILDEVRSSIKEWFNS